MRVYSAWRKCYADSTEDESALLNCTARTAWAPESAWSAWPGRIGHCPRPLPCKAASPTAATAWPPPLGVPCHTSYPGYNGIFVLLKKKQEQYKATEKLWWFSYPFLNRLHFQIPGTEDVPRLELHICKSQCVFLLSSLRFLGAPAARENSQLGWLRCKPATGRSNSLQKAKTFEWSDTIRGKKSARSPYPLPNPVFTLDISGCRGKLLALTGGYHLLHSSREPRRRYITLHHWF